jgi:hypothetical protein
VEEAIPIFLEDLPPNISGVWLFSSGINLLPANSRRKRQYQTTPKEKKEC